MNTENLPACSVCGDRDLRLYELLTDLAVASGEPGVNGARHNTGVRARQAPRRRHLELTLPNAGSGNTVQILPANLG